MTDRAYVEIEPSDLFLAHFYGPVGGPPVPETHEVTKIRVPLEITVPDNDEASGSVYLGKTLVNGEPCFRFQLTDGVDTHLADVRLSHMGCPVLTIEAI